MSSFCPIQEELNNLTKNPSTLTQIQPPDKARLPSQPKFSTALLQEEKWLALAIAFRERKMQVICFQLCNLPTLSIPWMKLLEKLCF